MRSYLKCRQCSKIFHIKRATTKSENGLVFVVCPDKYCQSPNIDTLPDAVIEAITRFAKSRDLKPEWIFDQLGYDSLNGCFHFTYASMYCGVETDGYIHT